MVERSAHDAEQAHDGILRLGSGKVVLEWLPEGASRDAADARRDEWDLIPWLIERLGLVQYGYTDLMVDGAPSPHQPDTTLRWLIDRPRS